MPQDDLLRRAMKQSFLERADPTGAVRRAIKGSTSRLEGSQRLFGTNLAPWSVADLFVPPRSRRRLP